MTQPVLEAETPPSDFDMRRIASKIVEEARQHSGFIITFKKSEHPEPIGFGFLAAKDRAYAAIYGGAAGLGERLKCEVVCFGPHLGYEEVVRQYLEKTASLIGIPFVKLTQDLCRRSFIWRFFGYVDHQGGETRDNGLNWRALWGRMVEIATPERLGLTGADDQAAARFLVDRLRQCAIESQIILDR